MLCGWLTKNKKRGGRRREKEVKKGGDSKGTEGPECVQAGIETIPPN